jgi:hypothetical protein
MFTKIKEFLFGKPAQAETPYKVEAPAKTVELTSIEDGSVKVTLPVQQDFAGHTDNPAEALAASTMPKAPVKKQPAKPKTPPAPKAPSKPRAPKKAAAK